MKIDLKIGLKISIEKDVDPATYQFFEDAIDHFNMRVTGHYSYAPVNVLLRDDAGAVVGGALGGIWGEWLYIKYLWVAEELRGQGYGSKLLALAESEATAAACRGIYLETYDFQAYSFYSKYGFQAQGQLQDFPPGHTYYLMKKQL